MENDGSMEFIDQRLEGLGFPDSRVLPMARKGTTVGDFKAHLRDHVPQANRMSFMQLLDGKTTCHVAAVLGGAMYGVQLSQTL